MINIFKQQELKVNIMLSRSCQLAALARPGCVMETAIVRTTQMKTTARHCASCLTTCVLPTTPSVCLPKSCVMALTTVQMALTRNFVVKHFLYSNTFLKSKHNVKLFNRLFSSVASILIFKTPPTVHTASLSQIYPKPFISVSCMQTCVHWTTVVVVTTAASFLERASCALVPWAWSWELTTRPAKSRASVPNTSSVARGASRRNPASNVHVTRAGSLRLTWRAAKVLVCINRNIFIKTFLLLQMEELHFGFRLRE